MIELKPGMKIKCNSEDEAKEFIKLAYKQGFKWNDGISKDNFTAWGKSNVDYTIYNLYDDMTITFSKRNYSFFAENLINYSDLKKRDYVTMTKKDLENEMVIETRDMQRALVIGNKLRYRTGHDFLCEYNDNLTNKMFKELDIMKIYRSNAFYLGDVFSSKYLELIWERKEQPKLSEKDKKVIKEGLAKAREYCKTHLVCDKCELYDNNGDCFLYRVPAHIEIDKLFED